VKFSTRLQSAAEVWSAAQALYLLGEYNTDEFARLIHSLATDHRWFAPGRFLRKDYEDMILAMEPSLIRKTTMLLAGKEGTIKKEIAAVLAPVSRDVAYVSFVDNEARVVYGQKRFWGYKSNEAMDDFVDDVMAAVDAAYRQETARNGGTIVPHEAPMLEKIRNVIAEKVQPSRRL
jgi:hypothetical protein